MHQSLVAVEKMQSDGTWAKRTYQVIDNLKQNAEAREVLVSDRCFEILEDIKRLKLANGREADEVLFPVNTPAEVEYKLYSLCKKFSRVFSKITILIPIFEMYQYFL